MAALAGDQLNQADPMGSGSEPIREQAAIVAGRAVDGLALWVVDLWPDGARLALGRPEEEFYRDAWDYRTRDDAIKAMCRFEPGRDVEPDGWERHVFSGRTRP